MDNRQIFVEVRKKLNFQKPVIKDYFYDDEDNLIYEWLNKPLGAFKIYIKDLDNFIVEIPSNNRPSFDSKYYDIVYSLIFKQIYYFIVAKNNISDLKNLLFDFIYRNFKTNMVIKDSTSFEINRIQKFDEFFNTINESSTKFLVVTNGLLINSIKELEIYLSNIESFDNKIPPMFYRNIWLKKLVYWGNYNNYKNILYFKYLQKCLKDNFLNNGHRPIKSSTINILKNLPEPSFENIMKDYYTEIGVILNSPRENYLSNRISDDKIASDSLLNLETKFSKNTLTPKEWSKSVKAVENLNTIYTNFNKFLAYSDKYYKINNEIDKVDTLKVASLIPRLKCVYFKDIPQKSNQKNYKIEVGTLNLFESPSKNLDKLQIINQLENRIPTSTTQINKSPMEFIMNNLYKNRSQKIIKIFEKDENFVKIDNITNDILGEFNDISSTDIEFKLLLNEIQNKLNLKGRDKLDVEELIKMCENSSEKQLINSLKEMLFNEGKNKSPNSILSISPSYSPRSVTYEDFLKSTYFVLDMIKCRNPILLDAGFYPVYYVKENDKNLMVTITRNLKVIGLCYIDEDLTNILDKIDLDLALYYISKM